MEMFTKITTGFVTQSYEKNSSGKFICTGQEFIAGDQVDYEDADGNAIDAPKHDYQPFNMTCYSVPHIAESIRKSLDWLQMRGKFDSGIETLKTLLKRLG